MAAPLDVFLLTRAWRDERDGLRLTYWGKSTRGPVRVVLRRQEAVLFVDRAVGTTGGRRKELALRSMLGRHVDAVYFETQRALEAERERLGQALSAPLESDVRPSDRFLMERFVTDTMRVEGRPRERDGYLELVDPKVTRGEGSPSLDVVALDIETDGPDGEVLSIAVSAEGEERVFMRSADTDTFGVVNVPDERALLSAFLGWIGARDPDVLVGWNVIEFDLAHLERRARALGMTFGLGRAGERATVLAPRDPSQPHVARVPGRVVLDGIATLRSATWTFESFALEAVAQELLGRGKRIAHGVDPVAEIRRMHREDRAALAAYNLEDCRLVREIFEATDLLGFAIERQRLTGLPMDRQGGSVAAFDWLYLPRLHRHGYVAPDVGGGDAEPSPGGHVLESVPGLHRDVLVFDFKSLYPSIIRTFRIDPMGLAFPGDDPVEGFAGGTFSRDAHILPGLIETLWRARDEAKRRRDAALSRAIKILMNSFYGVLGTPGCRFFSPKLASSITRRGHEIIGRTRAWLEERGHTVIYGDTDSLFALAGTDGGEEECRRVGVRVAEALNGFWAEQIAREHRLESHLELLFETHYLRFFMPTLRGSERGSKKRYAGLVRAPGGGTTVVIKGLEAARTDWTPLARGFQRELFRRAFEDEPIESFVRETKEALLAGLVDDQLTYTKRLRRDLDDYARNVPPHVVAARKLDAPGRSVSYVMTTRGPEPLGKVESPIDHRHYLEKQLAPAAEALLAALDTSFEAVAGDQMALF